MSSFAAEAIGGTNLLRYFCPKITLRCVFFVSHQVHIIFLYFIYFLNKSTLYFLTHLQISSLHLLSLCFSSMPHSLCCPILPDVLGSCSTLTPIHTTSPHPTPHPLVSLLRLQADPEGHEIGELLLEWRFTHDAARCADHTIALSNFPPRGRLLWA